MALAPGTKLGPYVIVGPLGTGGMGEVYRAKDTRLERTVAIKILPGHMSEDVIRKQRFEREAKVISSLNHPHICVLYDVGQQNGIDYLVMECVEGETLANHLERGPLPLDQVLKYGAQIAAALDKAHRGGLVHRDLKPGNIMLTPTGPKLLDFGLAKPAASLGSAAAMTAAAGPSPMTQEGTIVGTFQYMSPEQVEGKDVDGRSDIFSLGAVLYEMLTGTRAFPGQSQLSVASAILEKEPAPLNTIKPMTPPGLDHVVKKCLSKRPDERWQSAADVASELKWVSESGPSPVGAAVLPIPGKRRERTAWLIAGALMVALIVIAVEWRSPKASEQTMYFPAPLPFPARDVAVAPNGHTVAVVAYSESAARNMLWIYELGSTGARSLPDTEGASYPFWSADGQFLAFFADGKLKRLGVPEGPVQTICDAPWGRGGTWNKEGVIIFTPDGTLGKGLYRVDAAGGTPTELTKPDLNRGEQSHRWPVFLPDGKHYLYMTGNFSGQKGVDAIFVGSLGSNEKRFVVETAANADYVAPGYLLYYRNRTLLAQHFDLGRFAVTGEPTVLLADLQYQPQVKRAVFGSSDHRLLVAQTGSAVALSQLVWFDRKGKELAVVGKPDIYGNISLAPNGKFVAVDRTDMANQLQDVWTYEVQHGSTKRLTFGSFANVLPTWSPDSSRIAVSSMRLLGSELYMKNSDGSQEEKSILRTEVNNFANDWSKDGKYLLYNHNTDLWFVTIPELKSSLFLKAPSVVRNGQFSPDGKWVAYASNESGKWEIYVTSFPDARGKWQVSSGGGEQPRWRGDGKELLYLSSDGKMMAVPVTTGANFDAGPPDALFQTTPRQPVSLNDQFVYDVSPDRQQFLINTPVKKAENQPLSIVLNWTAKLTK
jgi:eukaryotic-like serine/threonine-protein kinase